MTTYKFIMRTTVTQCDSFAPLILSPGIGSISLNVCYLDDTTIDGHVDSVLTDIRIIILILSDIDLEVKATKFETSNVTRSEPDFIFAGKSIKSLLKGVRASVLDDLEFLAAPISFLAANTLAKNLQQLGLISIRLQLIDAHPRTSATSQMHSTP